ncbi:hypothetical protein [Mesobacillus thioparans]|uniref:hypothetical protein n=1 Tax=Mesobacillus thioparans TaxID=370439 RepID=UPI0039F0DBA1
MVAGVYPILLLGSILFLARKKDDSEPYFLLKIIGYFMLGSFAFTVNDFSVPLGFLVYLLAFRPKLNLRAKRLAAYFGVIAFILTYWILPMVSNEWEGRPAYIESELGSVYNVNFQDENELITQKLESSGNSWRLEEFEVEYAKDGRIIGLRWQLLGQNDNHFDLYNIIYETDKKKYRVTHSQVDSWLQYDELVDAGRFFEVMKELDRKELTAAKASFPSYVIRSSGQREAYAVEDEDNFILSDGIIQELTDDQLPVEGYSILTYGMEKTDEERDEQGTIIHESFQGADSAAYLFDVSEVEEDN